MSPLRLGALFRRVVAEIRRDRPSLALLFIAPVLVTGLLTFILREGQAPAVDAVVVNAMGAPGGQIESALRTALEANGGSVREVADEAAASQALRDDQGHHLRAGPVGRCQPAGRGAACPARHPRRRQRRAAAAHRARHDLRHAHR
jgi:hypothetical protein